MASEGQASLQSEPETWHGVVQRTLKRNDVRLVPYVPEQICERFMRGVGVRKEVKTG
jgi:hypothetical protein